MLGKLLYMFAGGGGGGLGQTGGYNFFSFLFFSVGGFGFYMGIFPLPSFFLPLATLEWTADDMLLTLVLYPYVTLCRVP